MNIDEQTRHPKTEWYKKLFTRKEDNGNIALLWNTEQCKRGFKLEEKKTAVEDQISDKKHKGY